MKTSGALRNNIIVFIAILLTNLLIAAAATAKPIIVEAMHVEKINLKDTINIAPKLILEESYDKQGRLLRRWTAGITQAVIYHYTYNPANDTSLIVAYTEQGQWLMEWQFHYNTKGQLLEKVNLVGNFALCNYYNYENNLISSEYIWKNNDTIPEIVKFKYNKKQKIATFTYLNNTLKSSKRFFYNTTGQISNTTFYNSSKKIKQKIIHQYKNNKLSKQQFYKTDSILLKTISNKYNKNGNLIEVSENIYNTDTGANKPTIYRTKYEYDKNLHRLTKETLFNPQNEPVTQLRYAYTKF